MSGKEGSSKKPTPAHPNKPKLQRRPLTQTTGDGHSTKWSLSTPFDPADPDSIPTSLQMISEPLKPGFVLSEKTINMNNYLAAIEAGLRSKTAAEMQLERRTTAAASQQSAQASGSSAGAGWTASGKAA
jgi:hypothetical protein